MGKIGVSLEESEGEELFEQARKRLEKPDSVGLTVGGSEPENPIPFDRFSDFYSAVYESVPSYKVEAIDSYVEDEGIDPARNNTGSLNSNGQKYRKKLRAADSNRDIFGFVFGHFEPEELVDQYGGTEEMFEDWTQGDSRVVDKLVFDQAASQAKEFYSSTPDIKPDIVDLDNYGDQPENSRIIEDADLGALQVLFYRKAHEDPYETAQLIEEGSAGKKDVQDIHPRLNKIYPRLFNQLLKVKEDHKFIKNSKISELSKDEAGFGLSFLEDLELIESWGSDQNGVYTIEAGKPEIYDAWRQVANDQKD